MKTTTDTITGHTASVLHGTGAGTTVHIGVHGDTAHGITGVGTTLGTAAGAIRGTAAGTMEDGMIRGTAAAGTTHGTTEDITAGITEGITRSTTITDGMTRTTATEQASLLHQREAAKKDITDSEPIRQRLR